MILNMNLSYDASVAALILLRETFKLGLLPQYIYDADPSKSKIFINLGNAQRIEKYPALTVLEGPMSSNIESMNQEVEMENEFTDGKRYISFGGSNSLTISIEILANQPKERTILTDFVAVCFRNLYKDKMSERGFEYTDISISAPSTAVGNNVPIFKNTISIDLKSFYNFQLEQKEIETISSIDVDALINQV